METEEYIPINSPMDSGEYGGACWSTWWIDDNSPVPIAGNDFNAIATDLGTTYNSLRQEFIDAIAQFWMGKRKSQQVATNSAIAIVDTSMQNGIHPGFISGIWYQEGQAGGAGFTGINSFNCFFSGADQTFQSSLNCAVATFSYIYYEWSNECSVRYHGPGGDLSGYPNGNTCHKHYPSSYCTPNSFFTQAMEGYTPVSPHSGNGHNKCLTGIVVHNQQQDICTMTPAIDMLDASPMPVDATYTSTYGDLKAGILGVNQYLSHLTKFNLCTPNGCQRVSNSEMRSRDSIASNKGEKINPTISPQPLASHSIGQESNNSFFSIVQAQAQTGEEELPPVEQQVKSGDFVDPGSFYFADLNYRFEATAPTEVILYNDVNGNGFFDDGDEEVKNETITLRKESDNATYDLNTGWNAINVPLVKNANSYFSAGELISIANGQGVDIRHVKKWDGSWKEYTVEGGTFGDNFDILPNQGYFVYAEDKGRFTLTGRSTKDFKYPINFNSGWSLVGFSHAEGDAEVNDAFGYLELMSKEGGVLASNITRYDSGVYRGVNLQENGEGKLLRFGINFNISKLEGYFVRTDKNGVYVP